MAAGYPAGGKVVGPDRIRVDSAGDKQGVGQGGEMSRSDKIQWAIIAVAALWCVVIPVVRLIAGR